MNKNIKLDLASLLVLILALILLLTACGGRQESKSPRIPDNSDTFPVEGQVHAPVRELVLSYLRNEYASEYVVYFTSSEPEVRTIGFGWITRDSQLYVTTIKWRMQTR